MAVSLWPLEAALTLISIKESGFKPHHGGTTQLHTHEYLFVSPTYLKNKEKTINYMIIRIFIPNKSKK